MFWLCLSAGSGVPLPTELDLWSLYFLWEVTDHLWPHGTVRVVAWHYPSSLYLSSLLLAGLVIHENSSYELSVSVVQQVGEWWLEQDLVQMRGLVSLLAPEYFLSLVLAPFCRSEKLGSPLCMIYPVKKGQCTGLTLHNLWVLMHLKTASFSFP